VPPDPTERPRHNGALPAGPATQLGAPGAPVLTVVTGDPAAEEIAALVVVLAARTAPAGPGGEAGAPRYEWSAKSRLVREPLAWGTGGWRASALPR
jgi:hypothetical protein